MVPMILFYLCTSHGPEQVLDAFLVTYQRLRELLSGIQLHSSLQQILGGLHYHQMLQRPYYILVSFEHYHDNYH